MPFDRKYQHAYKLYEHFGASPYRLQDIYYYFKLLTLQIQVKVTWHKNGTYAIRQRISTSTKAVLEHFSLAFTDSRYYILYFLKCCDLENIGQGHDVQHSQWRHSMTNINLYKSRIEHFALAITVFPDILLYNSTNCYLENQVKVMMHNIRNDVIRWQIYECLSDGNSNVYSISHHLGDKKC